MAGRFPEPQRSQKITLRILILERENENIHRVEVPFPGFLGSLKGAVNKSNTVNTKTTLQCSLNNDEVEVSQKYRTME